MTDVVLFHHARGLTDGVRRFAGRLSAGGHRVTVPDLFDGATFGSIDEGVAHAQEIGVGTVLERGAAAVADLPPETVYAGLSLGVLPAQRLAQERAGALGALLLFSAVPAEEFGSWPDGVALQLHLVDDDPWSEEDRPAAEELARTVPGAELFRYPGTGHLVCDDGLDDHDPAATELIVERSLAFLDRCGRARGAGLPSGA
ncbi:dienelactone hydrolase family protein [Geodermatophilus sp. SYSU D00691]